MTNSDPRFSAGSMDETFVEWLGKTRKKLEGMMSSTYDFPSDNEGIGHTGDDAQAVLMVAECEYCHKRHDTRIACPAYAAYRASQPSPAATVEMIETGPVTVNEWEDASRPQCSAGNGGALHDVRVLLQAIYDLIDDEDAAEPLDYAIAHAKKALAILDTLNEPQPARVSLLDDELLIEWGQPDVAISIDDDGFGYAIRRGNQFEPGVSDKWSGAVAEIRAALSLSRPHPARGES